MNHDQVATMWAAYNMGLSVVRVPVKGGERRMRVQDCARGSRLSFSGTTIDSHHWWPFARFETNKAGEKCVIFRSQRYSVSTSQHQSYARQALRKYASEVPVFDVHDGIDASHGERIKGYMQRIRSGFDLAIKARTHAPVHIENARAEHEEMLAYARFFNVKIPAWANPFANPAQLVAMESKLAELSIKTGIPINAFWRTT